MTLLVILGLLARLVLWVISVQRKLVSQDELCSNSMSQIGVQQQSRWDAISALVDLTRSYNEHEYKTLRDVIAMRKDINGKSSASEADAQEQALTGAIRQIQVVAENYPELKANESYIKTMDSVNLYENQVRTSRMVYNDSVTKYNRIVRQFPDSVVAGMFHFETKEYLKEVAEKADMPKINI